MIETKYKKIFYFYIAKKETKLGKIEIMYLVCVDLFTYLWKLINIEKNSPVIQ